MPPGGSATGTPGA
ncbi:hypothetical protein NPIL_620911, partial [Nephila pilipes]